MSKEKIPIGLVKDKSVVILSQKYLQKAQTNLITMDALFSLRDNQEARALLHLPLTYSPEDWIVVAGYYSMYLAATALLAKIGYKTKQHTAAIEGLEYFFVKKKLIEQHYIEMLKSASLSHEEVHNLSQARKDRELAQYGVTEETTLQLIERTTKNAHEFVDKVVSILNG